MIGIRPVIRLIQLSWWRWARAELTGRDPCHPDLPLIVHRINTLENEQC